MVRCIAPLLVVVVAEVVVVNICVGHWNARVFAHLKVSLIHTRSFEIHVSSLIP